jgi:FtsP/CotA-like multicopper oxidase with cupredoxin domain
MITFTRERFVFTCTLASTLLITPGQAAGASTVRGCPSVAPTIDTGLFQQALDATIPFDLQIVAMRSPTTNNLSLLYRAVRGGKIVAYNPTLVVPVGGTIDLTLRDCLSKSDIQNLQSFLPKQAPDTPPANPGFQVVQADEMTPTGYMNVHSHGLGGKPTKSVVGKPDHAAGDEVLANFIAPIRTTLTSPQVSNWQHYRITVPDKDPDDGAAAQDVGLYWYHPHFHGEAQQDVYLGLTGAIVVFPKGAPLDLKNAAANLFVVRDYPYSNAPFQPPTSTGFQAKRKPVLHSRELLRVAVSGAQPLTEAIRPQAVIAQPLAVPPNPACYLFQAPENSSSCLPDWDGGYPDYQKQALNTLVTVNGVQTEHLTTDANGTPSNIQYTPVDGDVSRPLRVLNASANTYLKLALVSEQVPQSVDLTHPDPKLLFLPLTVISRDGHPLPAMVTTSPATILLPPGSRAEFRPAVGPGRSVSLVSQYVYTGPAGDLVPYRVLATLNPSPVVPAVALHGPAAAESTRQTVNVQGPTRYTEAFSVQQPLPVHRAFAFFEQNRACTPPGNCGTSFYLIDITASAVGISGSQKTPVTAAKPFMMPMNPDGSIDTNRDHLFSGPGRTFNPSIPAVQIALHKQPRVNEIWDIYNFTAEYHAFHIHQLGFGVIQSCAPKYLSDQGKGPDCTAIVDDSGDEDHEANLLLDVINVPFAISIPHSDGTKTAYYPWQGHDQCSVHPGHRRRFRVALSSVRTRRQWNDVGDPGLA